MRFSIKRRLHNGQPRIVLILQGSTAYWFKVAGETVVDSFNECLPVDIAVHGSLCPWLEASEGSGPVSVELVLDTTLDEIDRVTVEQSNMGLVNRYRQFMTMARLRRDYSQAKVYAVPGGNQATVAALMHPSIPEQWVSWLLLLQSSNLVFHRVATGCELAAFWSRHRDENLMIVMQVADYERHMLVQCGAVLFLRTVPLQESEDEALSPGEGPPRTTIDQSMEYLDAVVDMEVHAMVVIDSVDQISVLLAMLLGQRVEYKVRWMDAGVNEASNSSIRLPLKRYRQGGARLVRFWNRFSVCLLAAYQKSSGHWSLRRSVLRKLSALAPSVRYARSSYRVAFAFRMSVVLAVMAAIAASSALVHGVVSKRLLKQDEVRQISIKSEQTDIHSTSAALFLLPEVGADSLFIADKLSGTESEYLTAEQLLQAVATAVTAVPDLQLDRLIWAPVARDEPYDSLTNSLDSVSNRQGIDSDNRRFAVQLEVSGQVSGETLEDQQTTLKRFVSELSKIPGTLNLTVLESPLDSALSSDSDAKRLGLYRVSLLLGKK